MRQDLRNKGNNREVLDEIYWRNLQHIIIFSNEFTLLSPARREDYYIMIETLL